MKSVQKVSEPVTRQQALGELRRGQLLQAAQRVFAREGFAATHVEDIAREAGLAKGTVYLYFSSKQEIYRAVILQQFRLLNELTCETLRQPIAIREKVYQYIRMRLEYCDSNRDFLRMMLTEVGSVAGQPVMTRVELQELCSKPVHELAAHIRTAVSSGHIQRVDPQSLAWMIADLVRGASERRVMGQSSEPAEKTARLLVKVFWQGLEPNRSADQRPLIDRKKQRTRGKSTTRSGKHQKE